VCRPFAARTARDVSSVFGCALLVRMCSPLPFSPLPPHLFPFKPVVRSLEITTADLDRIWEGHQNLVSFLLFLKLSGPCFPSPGSIRVVRFLCGLPGGKKYYFGHFCVWFSGPERADHTRTDTRCFGLVVLFHCSFLVCIYF
jgi:hypothetical protein